MTEKIMNILNRKNIKIGNYTACISCYRPYFKAGLHGHNVRLNVAKEVWIRENGKPQTGCYLYSINDINE